MQFYTRQISSSFLDSLVRNFELADHRTFACRLKYINSILLFFIIIGAVAAILIRTLRRDIDMYNQEDEEVLLFIFA